MYTFLHISWKAYLIFGIINLNILINMQLSYIKVEYEIKRIISTHLLQRVYTRARLYCIVFYIKIYTQCINVSRDSTNVKSSPV